MKPTIARAALFVLLVFPRTAGIASAQESPSYKQGTITKSEGAHKACELKGAEALYHIKNCGGDFQTGQAVDYRLEDFTIYLRRQGGREYRCTVGSVDSVGDSFDTPPPPTYQQGTILGYDIRRDTSVFGSGGANGTSVGTSTRLAKVYQLKATNVLYKVDYCGAFQAGQFQVGQVVDFRIGEGIDGERLYIRHDGDKEFSCKIEGVSAVEGAKPDAASSETSTPH